MAISCVARRRSDARASCTTALRCTSASVLRVFSSGFSRQPRRQTGSYVKRSLLVAGFGWLGGGLAPSAVGGGGVVGVVSVAGRSWRALDGLRARRFGGGGRAGALVAPIRGHEGPT